MKKTLSLILAALMCAAMTPAVFADEALEVPAAPVEDTAVIEEIAADDAGIMLISELEGQIVAEAEEVVVDAETISAIAALCGVEVTPEFVEALLAFLAPAAEEVVEEVAEEAAEEVAEEAAEEVAEEAAEEVVEEAAEEVVEEAVVESAESVALYALAVEFGVAINDDFVAQLLALVAPVEEAVAEEAVVEEVVAIEEEVVEVVVEEEVVEEEVSKYPVILEETPTFGLFGFLNKLLSIFTFRG